jgi:hypothetical protein
MMLRAARIRLAGLALLATAALASCGLGGDEGQATTTLPTLPPSSGVTHPPTTAAPSTAPPATAPATAPVGGPNTLPPDPGLVTTAPDATTPGTTVAGRITYIAEPSSGALRVGHRGSRVQQLQTQLVRLGYQIGVDGYFGRGTEGAVTQFQQAQGLPPDGIAGPATLERLGQVAPAG